MQSVGEYLASETSVGSVASVGRYFCGGVGMAGMPYPPIVCTVCFVGALLALASGKAERRQLHPLEVCNKVAEYFSELCQRLFFS